MTLGKFYGIGVGPGDTELITVKGSRILARMKRVFVPKARIASESVALAIAKEYIGPESQIIEQVFPMTPNREELARKWDEAARQIAETLQEGEDACFLTLGDPLFYSTYIYLHRALRAVLPDLEIVTIPGITSFAAAAALTGFTVGEGKTRVIIVPTADDLSAVKEALAKQATVVLMKIGDRLREILDILEESGAMEGAVLVSHAGMPDQRIETDLRTLRNADPKAGYLSVILVHARGEEMP